MEWIEKPMSRTLCIYMYIYIYVCIYGIQRVFGFALSRVLVCQNYILKLLQDTTSEVDMIWGCSRDAVLVGLFRAGLEA